jgi:hypothetical protein
VKRAIVLAISVLLALVVAMPMTFAQVGQGANKSGTAAELAAAWWQWASSKPVEVNPLRDSYPGGAKCDGTPVTPTQGKWWFLAGTQDGSVVERTCTMPVGTKLFFPVVNIVAFPFFENETRQNQRQLARQYIREVVNAPDFSMSVTVDGKEVKSNRIVRALSPVFSLTVPEDNIYDCPQCATPFDLPAGTYDDASANGLWVTLPPLSPGEHTIHFEMSAQTKNFGLVTQDNTYILTVVNSKPAP